MKRMLICSVTLVVIISSCLKPEISFNEELLLGNWQGQKVIFGGEEIVDFNFYDFFGTGCFFVSEGNEYSVCYQSGIYAIEANELILPFPIYPGGNLFRIEALTQSELILESRFTAQSNNQFDVDGIEKGEVYTITRYYEKK